MKGTRDLDIQLIYNTSLDDEKTWRKVSTIWKDRVGVYKK